MKNKYLLSLFSIIFLLTMTACGVSQEQVISYEVNVEQEKEVNDADENAISEDINSEVEEESIESEELVEEDIEESESNTEENPRDGPEVSAAYDNLELLKVHFIDVGQADATLFEYTHEGEEFKILFDTGNWNRNDVVNYLKNLGVSSIDIIIGSHPHADHIGQLDTIINEFDVTEVWMSGDTTTSQTFQRVMDTIEQSGVEYHEPRAGEIYDVGPLEIAIINPDRLTGDVHDGSVSAKFTYGDNSFVLTGDAEAKTEQAMLDRDLSLDADVLQLGHHGSTTSTTAPFLAAVSPSIAVISAGENNQYGHPHDDVVNRVTDAGIDLYATHVHGTIIIESDGQSLNVLTKEDGTVSPTSSGQASASSAPVAATATIESTTEESEEDLATADTGSCVDINSASVADLEAITHIGPARAEEVVQMRPFNSVDDLTRVKGIAAGRLADIKSEGIACAR